MVDGEKQDKAYDVAQIRKNYSNAYASWTAEADERLRKLCLNQLEDRLKVDSAFIRKLALEFGRKPGAITSRINKLFGLESKDNKVKKISSSPTPVVVPTIKIDFNPQFQQAWELMENSPKTVFITGKAGTGKSTLLNYFRSKTKKKAVVLAPTGVAALNVAGQTVHSFFGFKTDITLDRVRKLSPDSPKGKLYKEIEAIVIDEISMVRADLLDCVDKFMRLNGPSSRLPFGGVQMIFIGDLYQLPPVVTSPERDMFRGKYSSPYFFDAAVMQGVNLELVELETVYRQKDEAFVALLNTIRNNSATEEHLAVLNERYLAASAPNTGSLQVYLTTTNKLADEINGQELGKLSGKSYVAEALVAGDLTEKSFPTDRELNMKPGAQVMFVNNDQARRWVNGTMGKIIKIDEDKELVVVRLTSGKVVEVTPHTWEVTRYIFDKNKSRLDSESVGSFTQFPLMLAWAVTIHKSQGKTFDRIIIDIGNGTFVPGQLYVALSRCTTLSGITLKKPLEKKHIFIDWRVVEFMTSFCYQVSENQLPLKEKLKIIKRAIDENLALEITYLKRSDEKSKRVIEPLFLGEMEFQGKSFTGLRAQDSLSGEERSFRVERILEMKEL